MALLLPAVGSARASSRRLECQNKLRNLGMAMLHVADQDQRFPAAGNFGSDANGQLKAYHGWVVKVLPWIDQKPLFDQWQFDDASNLGTNLALSQTPIPLLVCPVDGTLLGGGDLSYVVNSGFGFTSAPTGVGDCPVDTDHRPIDFNGNGITCPADSALDGPQNDKVIFEQTALFFAENWPPRTTPNGTHRFHRLADVTDGLSQTLMMTENVRAGRITADPTWTWGSPWPSANCFFVSSTVCANNTCTAENVDYSRANQGDHAINAGQMQRRAHAPWPSSNHGPGVNVVFVDGRVRFLSEYIDGRVYAALMSPQGAQIVGPLAQSPISDADY